MRKAILIGVVISVAALATIFMGCGGSGNGGCQEGEGAMLMVTTNPSPASIYADGNKTVRVTISGQDETCTPIKNTQVNLTISEKMNADGVSDDAVGTFKTGDGTPTDTLTVTMGQFGGSAEIKSSKAGTARLTAFCPEYNLSAAPIALTFTVPPVTGQCAVAISVDPTVIPPDGISTSDITASLTGDTGDPMPDGTGVTFTTTLGKFTESGATDYSTTTNGNVATATLQSAQVSEDTDVTVTATFQCDDGKQHSNDEQVHLGQLNMPSVNLQASADSVFADNASTVDLTAEVFLPGGTKAGEGVEVDFLTDLGRFQESDGPTYTAYTDTDGKAYATFIGGMQQGEATIEAGVFIENKNAFDDVTVNIKALGNILFVSAIPSKLGVKGSGRDESSTLIFALRDTNDDPFPAGALVTFAASMAPGVTLDPTADRTDDQGLVSTTLNAGRQSTTVTVTATAQIGAVTLNADSPSIAIVGAKPNARYITFSCKKYNIGGFVIDFLETECTVALADRYSNKIGFSTNVHFRIEAGAITSESTTSDTGANMGLATTSARTQDPRPADVQPVMDEPVIGSNNPRDGLVAIIAATTGEEEFTDQNGNGEYDAGEPFVDQGEPFVDENDNGIREPTEQFIDSNSNSIYDGPNGIWDSDTLISDTAWILWTGGVTAGVPLADCGKAPGNRYSVICPASFDILKGGSLQFNWEAKDFNLNPPNETLGVNIKVTGKGSDAASNPNLPFSAYDTLGGSELWTTCGGGFCGWVDVDGAALTDTTPAEAGTVELNIDWHDSPGAGAGHTLTISAQGTFR
ncbi:MAG TPA: hypothetical protein VM425_15310 [Myxococcota bacterium]|nr:hypothetical protein [Myxococcota bacterium]